MCSSRLPLRALTPLPPLPLRWERGQGGEGSQGQAGEGASKPAIMGESLPIRYTELCSHLCFMGLMSRSRL